RGAVEAGVADGLTRLAEVLGAGRLVTVGARGFFGPETDYLGVMGGFAHDRVAEATRRADVVLVVGASLNPYSMRFGQMFAPDAGRSRVAVLAGPPGPASALTVSADARLAVPAILDEVERLGPPASEWAATVAALAGVQSEREAGDDLAPDGRLDPRRVA